MFFLFQIFNPESIMSAGMFDLPHGMSPVHDHFLMMEASRYEPIFE